MIDNIFLEAECGYPSSVMRNRKEPFDWNGLAFKPIYAKGKEIAVVKYEADFQGLRFILDGVHLTISNSLHKFYKGNNYVDFTYSDINDCIDRIESLTKIPAEHFKVRSMEFGLNLTLDFPVDEIINTLRTYKTKYLFEPMKKGTHVYGKKCVLTEYVIKFYDKVKQVKLSDRFAINENILRIEVVFNKNRVITGIETLKDLRANEKLEILIEQFQSYFNHIFLAGAIDFTKTDSRGRELFFAGTDIGFWEVERKMSKDTCKDKKKRFKKVSDSIFMSNHKSKIVQQVDAKFRELLDS